jgi:hypothetical protein
MPFASRNIIGKPCGFMLIESRPACGASPQITVKVHFWQFPTPTVRLRGASCVFGLFGQPEHMFLIDLQSVDYLCISFNFFLKMLVFIVVFT